MEWTPRATLDHHFVIVIFAKDGCNVYFHQNDTSGSPDADNAVINLNHNPL